MKQIVLSFVLALSTIVLSAQSLERIHTNDGCVYYGYISSQTPGKKIEVKTVASKIISDKAMVMNSSMVTFSNLGKEWQEFLADNSGYIADTSKIIVSDVKVGDSSIYQNSIVLRSGAVVEFLALMGHKHSIEWSNYNKVVRIVKPANEFSWVVSTLETKDGRFINGQMIEQINGKYISVLTDRNEMETIMLSNIKCIKFHGFSESVPLFNQSRTLDILNLKNDSVKGIITENCPNNYILLTKEDGSVFKANASDIVSLEKIINSSYKSIKDFEVKQGEYYYNGDTLSRVKFDIDDTSLILNGTISLEVKRGEMIDIITSIPENAFLYLVKARTIEEQVKKGAFTWLKKKPKDSKQDTAVYYKTIVQLKDLFASSIPAKKTKTPLGNTKVEFTAQTSGLYVMFVQGNDYGVVIKVN